MHEKRNLEAAMDNFSVVNAKMDVAEATHVELAYEASADPSDIDSIEKTSTGAFIWLCTIAASTGGALFGYDTAAISAVLVYIKNDLGHPLSAGEKEAITSLCSAGAFFGAIIAGMTADKYGRKGGIYAGCLLFTIGALLQATAYSLAQMCIGRLVVGFGVGSAAMIVPLYIAEIAPTKYRGRMVGLNNMSITGGQVIAYAIGAALAHTPHGWRYMVGLGGVPSIALACMMPFCPESPRHLIARGHPEEASAVLQRIFRNATTKQVDDKVEFISQAIDVANADSAGASSWQLIKELHTIPSNFRALVSACGLMVLSQLSGFNVLMYYSSTLFALVGFSNPTAVGLVVAAGNFVMTFINAMVVDPWGRRKLLLSTVWGMSAGLLAVAIAFHWIPINLDTLELEEKTITAPAIVVLVFIIWFVLFYGISVGNTAWMSTDFFPMRVRAMGTTWMTCCNWAPNLIVSSSFLSMLQSMTPSGTFGFYAAICFIGYVWLWFFYPEVSGLTVEEVSEVFKHGFGVRYASELRKKRKAEGTLIQADPNRVALGH